MTLQQLGPIFYMPLITPIQKQIVLTRMEGLQEADSWGLGLLKPGSLRSD